MTHPMHQSVVDMTKKAIDMMDGFLRDRLDPDEYADQLRSLEADKVLAMYQEDFKTDVSLVYYLDALMLLDSLSHQLHFQVAEYGANVALEDMKNLKELQHKFPKDQGCACTCGS